MYKLNLKKQLHGCLYLLSAMALFSTSCVDENYDLSKDIDMTLGVGTEGLSVKLGTTDKILLKDIIDEDENIKTDAQSRYYMIEEGSFETNFDVESVSSDIDPITFETGDVFKYDDIKKKVEEQTGIDIPENMDVPVPADLYVAGKGEGEASFALDLKDIDKAIVRILEVHPQAGTKVSLKLDLAQTGELNFALDTIKSLTISLPEFLSLTQSDIHTLYPYKLVGQTLVFTNVVKVNLNKPFVVINVDHFDLKDEGTVVNGAISLPKELCKVIVKGSFAFTTASDFKMTKNDNVRVSANVGFVDQSGNANSKITIHKVLGNFNPEINPEIDPIDIASSLPDFLQDDDVYLDVANPTLKIEADLSHQADRDDVPFNLFFSGDLKAEKPGQEYNTVKIPETEIVTLKKNYFYFSQMEEPYESGEIPEGANLQQIENLSDLLIPKIPDFITIDMKDGKVHVDQNREYMVTLNSSYSPKMNYKIMVPFLFNKGLKIVYKDSTESIGDDLKDLAAKGVKVTTDVHTTIPLNLHIKAEAIDANGQLIALDGEVTAEVPACKNDAEEIHPIELTINLKKPEDLSRIDRVRFVVHADAKDNPDSRELRSDQYLFMKDIRVKLNGQVIVDLN